ANKVRSLLTMLGIIIGVGAVIAMVGVGSGASASVTSRIQGLGSNLLTVSPGQSSSGGVKGGAGSSNTLTMSDVTKIQQQAQFVKAVAPSAGKSVQVVYDGANTSTTMTGTSQDYPSVRNITMATGRFFSQTDVQTGTRVAVVGPTVVQDLFGSSNVNIVGKTIKLDNVPFLVIGVTASQGSSGFFNADDMIYVPITTAQDRLIGNKYVRQIFLEATSANDMTAAQDEVTTILRRAHGLTGNTPSDFQITNQADILATMQGVTQSLTMLLGGIAAISLIVGGIGIMNIMLVSVTERTREIGIRKAIGAKESDILIQFLIEAVVLSALGGGIGIGLGYGGSLLASKLMSMQATVPPSTAAMAFGFSALIGIVFGVFPAKKASALNPIEALRYE
ncbi:MAG: ABC transporter permease, partial [Peptococcaceae bacterium]|nr:ABC transporter permease [Peptococcaceae bacterium]